jgi:sporulation related protein
MVRRIARYLATFGMTGVLIVGAVFIAPLVWPPDPDASLVLRNGQLMGETVGYVWQTSADSGTVYVSASVVGLRTIPVTVTAGTRINVAGKEGAFADLVRSTPVRVVYESRDHVRLASSIELLVQGSGEAIDAAQPRVEHATATGYWVEMGVFADPEAADRLVTRLLEQNLTVSIESATSPDGEHRVLRVQVGPYADEASAVAVQQNLRTIGYQAQLTR